MSEELNRPDHKKPSLLSKQSDRQAGHQFGRLQANGQQSSDLGRETPGYGYGYGFAHESNHRMADEDDGANLLDYWRILKRRRGTIFLCAALGGILAGLLTFPQTRIYRSSATLEVQELNPNFLNMRDIQFEGTPSNTINDIQTQIRILTSDSLLQKVARQMNLKSKETSNPKLLPDRVDAWRRILSLPDPEPASWHSTAVAMAADNVKARGVGQTRIIELSVESVDNDVAADFANRLANEYIEQNIEARWQATQRAGDFLTRQLDDLRVKLERSEDSLQRYAKDSGLLFTDEKTNVNEEKLKQLQDSLTSTQSDLTSKQSRWEMARTAPPESLPDILNDPALREYANKLAELRRQRAELEETYTADNPRVRRVDAQMKSLIESLENERKAILRRIGNDYEEAKRRVSLMSAAYQKQATLVFQQRESAIQYGILRREVETNRQVYESTLQKVKESSIATAMRASNIRVVDEAKPASMPFKPDVPKQAGVGLVGGLALGVGLSILLERANRALRDPLDVQFYLQTPELGVIPTHKLTGKKRLGNRTELDSLGLLEGAVVQEQVELVVAQKRTGMTAEGFRAALTGLMFSMPNQQLPKTLAVTSSGPGEGKTTIVTNLALALAEAGKTVLLIDADTRKPRIHKIWELHNEEGLTTLLRDRTPIGTAYLQSFVRGTPIPELSVLTSGPSVVGPTHLLYSDRFKSLLATAKDDYDIVLVDTPPMLQIPDARAIGKMVDAMILVVRAGRTSRDAAMAATQKFKEDGTFIVGTVMNDWNPEKSKNGYYGYYDGYGRYYKRYHGYYTEG